MTSIDLDRSDFNAPAAGASVLALVGLAFEAKIASTRHVLALYGQEGRRRFEDHLAPLSKDCRAMISFGVAGGLAPGLKPGDLIVASSIVDRDCAHRTDSDWCERLLDRLPDARHAPIAGVDEPIVHPDQKRELAQRTGAAAVDMESHVVARSALSRGLSFVAIRVIVDPAHRAVPEAAVVGMRPDGTTSVGAVLSHLLGKPSQLKDIARIALDMRSARTTLLRVRDRLGHGFGHVGLDEAEDSAAVLYAGARPPSPTGVAA